MPSVSYNIVMRKLGPAIALAAVALGGFGLWSLRTDYRFLPGGVRAQSMGLRFAGPVRATAVRYVPRECIAQVLDRIRAEYPLHFERVEEEGGREAIVVSVPRKAAYGADVSFPPEREIVLVDGNPPSVVVREYRSETPIDRFVDWMQRPFGRTG
jgi:hypothetical protein